MSILIVLKLSPLFMIVILTVIKLALALAFLPVLLSNMFAQFTERQTFETSEIEIKQNRDKNLQIMLCAGTLGTQNGNASEIRMLR
ncbi:hypothetical protein BpHYR1_038630 [Brachionus plicatilis]|uniref:Uncharacterized protein n=1 Tax=Brachionus plicatilis TaxID=10195 RepID=A0A3M7P4V9_BRAPC|nr:hypothetical protein BpHYR1_038630 [Brachionus plicatilis]